MNKYLVVASLDFRTDKYKVDIEELNNCSLEDALYSCWDGLAAVSGSDWDTLKELYNHDNIHEITSLMKKITGKDELIKAYTYSSFDGNDEDEYGSLIDDPDYRGIEIETESTDGVVFYLSDNAVPVISVEELCEDSILKAHYQNELKAILNNLDMVKDIVSNFPDFELCYLRIYENGIIEEE